MKQQFVKTTAMTQSSGDYRAQACGHLEFSETPPDETGGPTTSPNVVRFPNLRRRQRNTVDSNVELAAARDQIEGLRSCARREIRKSLLLLDYALFKLGQAPRTDSAAGSIAEEKLAAIDKLLALAREAARRI